MISKNKRGNIQELSGLVVMILVAFFTLGIGAVMLSNFGSQFVANSSGANITNNGLAGLNAIASQGSTLGYVVVLLAIVGVLAGFIYLRK